MSGSKKVIGFAVLQAMVWTMSERLQQERANEYSLHCLRIYCSWGMPSLSWPKWALYQNVASGYMAHPLIWNFSTDKRGS